MKKIMVLIALLMVVAMLVGCSSIVQALHPGQTKVAGVWVDNSAMDKYDFSMNSIEAEMKGDTYCKKCDKVNPGRVRICTYCGKYI